MEHKNKVCLCHLLLLAIRFFAFTRVYSECATGDQSETKSCTDRTQQSPSVSTSCVHVNAICKRRCHYIRDCIVYYDEWGVD